MVFRALGAPASSLIAVACFVCEGRNHHDRVGTTCMISERRRHRRFGISTSIVNIGRSSIARFTPSDPSRHCRDCDAGTLVRRRSTLAAERRVIDDEHPIHVRSMAGNADGPLGAELAAAARTRSPSQAFTGLPRPLFTARGGGSKSRHHGGAAAGRDRKPGSLSAVSHPFRHLMSMSRHWLRSFVLFPASRPFRPGLLRSRLGQVFDIRIA